MADIIQLRRDTAANWTSVDPTLANGEMGHETDTGKSKVGDGVTAWTSLSYTAGGAVDSVNTQTGVVVLDTDDIAEGSTNEYYTEAKVAANSAVAANTAKVTNATHTGDVVGDTALTIQATAISGQPAVGTLSGTEEVMVDDGGNLKKTTTHDIADLAPAPATHTGEVTGATTLTVDPTAVSNKTLKSTLAGTEELLINDGGTLKKTTADDIADLASGGGGGDYLTELTAATITITNTSTTLTIGRQHLVTATTTAYTETLPAASGNADKFCSIIIDESSTKLVTLKGNASELIDGENERIMWAGEVMILYCDGTEWRKIAGISKPMVCHMVRNSSQSGFTSGAAAKVLLNSTETDNTGLMANTGSNRIDIKRDGVYTISGTANFKNLSANSSRVLTQLRLTGSSVKNSEGSALSGGYPAFYASTEVVCEDGDYIELYGFQNSGSSQSIDGYTTAIVTDLLIRENI